MPYYISASDETSGESHLSKFTHGGFIADSRDWERSFVPEWRAMLAADPPIDGLHMNELRSRLKPEDADRKLDEAIAIIRRLQTVVRLRVTEDGAAFRAHLSPLLEDPDFKASMHPPDREMIRTQFCAPDTKTFTGYALFALKHAHTNRARCDRVDFYVEEKERFTKATERILRTQLAETCEYIGEPECIPLIGAFVPVPKTCASPGYAFPVQAADLLLWLCQREAAGRLSAPDLSRLNLLRAVPGWDHDEDPVKTEEQGKRWREMVKKGGSVVP